MAHTREGVYVMAAISELRLSVSRTVNLGNYESVKLEASALVSRNSDDDTPQKLRAQLLDEIAVLLEAAESDHVPARRSRYKE